MKKLKSITVIALILCLLIFSLTILDYLALHDIKQDYLSRDIIEQYELTSSKEIPDWTATPGEWLAVNVSLVIRFFLLVFIVIVLINYLKKVKYADK